MPWRIYKAYSIPRKDRSQVLRKRFVQCTVCSSSSFNKMCKIEFFSFYFHSAIDRVRRHVKNL